MTYADFPIVYNGITFMVDPFYFCHNSQRFRDIFHPGYSGFSQVTINGNFQPLSVDLFCSICQNQQVTVPQECVNDIATLARIFVAEPVVSNYIGNVSANPNGSIIFENRRSINQAYDDFDWLNNYGYEEAASTQNTNFNFENQYINAIANPSPDQPPTFENTLPTNQFQDQPFGSNQYQEQNQTFGTSQFQEQNQTFGTSQFQEQDQTFGGSQFQDQNQYQDQNQPFGSNQYQDPNELSNQIPISEENPNQLPDSSQLSQSTSDFNYNSAAANPDGLADPMPHYNPTPTIYEVQFEKKLIKCNRYQLLKNGQVVATAKTRTGSIVLNVGFEAHFKQMDQSAGEIQRFSFKNIVTTDGKQHEVKYFRDADTGYMTLHVLFYINNDHLLLTGLKKMPKEKIFGTLKVLDESHPCTLYLKNGKTAMTFTQTSKSTYTIECHLDVSNIFAFAIFMCAVTGPHTQFSSEFQNKEE